jgi:hypothetical protein
MKWANSALVFIWASQPEFKIFGFHYRLDRLGCDWALTIPPPKIFRVEHLLPSIVRFAVCRPKGKFIQKKDLIGGPAYFFFFFIAEKILK